MTRPSLRSNHFILEAFDCDLWCPVAQTLFHVAEIGPLPSILGAAADKDPEVHKTSHLDDEQLAMVSAATSERPVFLGQQTHRCTTANWRSGPKGRIIATQHFRLSRAPDRPRRPTVPGG